MPWNITPAQSKQEKERCHVQQATVLSTKDQRDNTGKCSGVFDCQLILKFFIARNIFMFPEIYSSLFFLKAVSFSCCLQLLTPIKCNWMCRKSKGPAAVVSSLIYILQNWNIFYIITDRLTSSNELVFSSSATRQRQLFWKAPPCLQCWKEHVW